MTTTPMSATVLLPPPAPGSIATTAATTMTAATSPQLGATVLPTTTPTMDATLGALTKLLVDLAAIVEALKGANALGGGPTKGGGHVQTPLQSPMQVPTKTAIQGGGPVAGGGAAAPIAPATATPVTALQPVAADYTGPHMAAERMTVGQDFSTIMRGSTNSGIDLKFLGRFASIPNEVSVRAPGVQSTRVEFPDSGSLTLSTGATFSWSPRIYQYGSSTVNDPNFVVTRAGQQVGFTGSMIDQVDGYGERVASPLTDAELAEVVSALARSYPAAR